MGKADVDCNVGTGSIQVGRTTVPLWPCTRPHIGLGQPQELTLFQVSSVPGTGANPLVSYDVTPTSGSSGGMQLSIAGHALLHVRRWSIHQFLGTSINTAGSATIGTGLTVTSGGATITAAGVAISAGGLAVVGGSATDTLKVTGNQGFYNTAPISKQTVSGSKASNAALASLITALAALGLVTDSTS